MLNTDEDFQDQHETNRATKKTKNPEKACGKLTDTTDGGNYVLILTLAADLVSRGSLKKLFTN